MEDLISRQAAINEALTFLVEYCGAAFDEYMQNELYQRLILLPSAQPEHEILLWLLAYHTKSFELHGRYLPHEVIGWLVHDFANAYQKEGDG